MRIGINGRILASDKLRGWGRYTANLVRELSQLDVDLFLISDKTIHHEHLEGANFENLKIIIEKVKPYFLWEQKTLPDLCQKLDLNILHCPHHFGLPSRGDFKKVLTLHDSIEDQFYNAQKSLGGKLQWSAIYSDFLRWFTRKNADGIITVSQYSKQDLVRFYGIPEQKIQVTYNAVDPHLASQVISSTEDIRKRFGVQPPYLLYVGGFDRRKNIAMLVEATQELIHSKKIQLVIAGHGASQQGFTPQEGLHLIEYLSESDLASLYTHAHAFIYPSLFEGFGLQALEAMHFGTPALVSNRTSLPEIVANEELLFDPLDPKSLKQLVVKTLDDADFYNKSVDASIKRAADFSWKTTALQTLEFYRQLVGVGS